MIVLAFFENSTSENFSRNFLEANRKVRDDKDRHSEKAKNLFPDILIFREQVKAHDEFVLGF